MLVVAAELVGNAIRHGRPLAGGRVEVTWNHTPDGVEISVSDGGGTTRPARVDSGPLATGGRGLRIVAELADDWGVLRRDGGSTVWARVRARVSLRR